MKRENFFNIRKNNPKLCAIDALKQARELPEGKTVYAPSSSARNAEFKIGRSTLQWCENPRALGLREIGPCSDILKRQRDVGAWYCDEFQDRTVEGIVFQLPARGGCAQFVAGYRTSDDDENAAAICFAIETGKRDDNDAHGHSQAARDTANSANDIAERVAESEREYNAAWQAGNAWRSVGEELAAMRTDARALIADIRASAGEPMRGAICKAVQSTLRGLLVDIEASRVKRAKLADGDWDCGTGWRTYDKNMVDAFNESAGRVVVQS